MLVWNIWLAKITKMQLPTIEVNFLGWFHSWITCWGDRSIETGYSQINWKFGNLLSVHVNQRFKLNLASHMILVSDSLFTFCLCIAQHVTLCISYMACRNTWSENWCFQSRNLHILISLPLHLFCYGALLILKAHILSFSGLIIVLQFSGLKWLLPKCFLLIKQGMLIFLFWINTDESFLCNNCNQILKYCIQKYYVCCNSNITFIKKNRPNMQLIFIF